MEVRIVADEGTHLLIASGEQYAIIERRNDLVYNCHGDKRQSIPVKELARVDQILDAGDWTDKETAQAAFGEVVSRGTELAQRML